MAKAKAEEPETSAVEPGAPPPIEGSGESKTYTLPGEIVVATYADQEYAFEAGESREFTTSDPLDQLILEQIVGLKAGG